MLNFSTAVFPWLIKFPTISRTPMHYLEIVDLVLTRLAGSFWRRHPLETLLVRNRATRREGMAKIEQVFEEEISV